MNLHNYYKTSNHMMKTAHILHNPGAGQDEFSDQELIGLIQENGFSCQYSSLDTDDWKAEFTENDFLIVIGGDGTVRRVVKELLARGSDLNFLIALVPAGTANNIAKTLVLASDLSLLVKSWHQGKVQHFEFGWVKSAGEPSFFLESFGYGLFPKLMTEMKKVPKALTATPDLKIKKGLEVLRALVPCYPSSVCMITVDDRVYEGKFIMVEVMNTRSLGPNLILAPDASPADGRLDLVLVAEEQRLELMNYIDQRIAGEELPFQGTIVTGKRITIECASSHNHADDEVIKQVGGGQVTIEIYERQIRFLVP